MNRRGLIVVLALVAVAVLAVALTAQPEPEETLRQAGGTCADKFLRCVGEEGSTRADCNREYDACLGPWLAEADCCPCEREAAYYADIFVPHNEMWRSWHTANDGGVLNQFTTRGMNPEEADVLTLRTARHLAAVAAGEHFASRALRICLERAYPDTTKINTNLYFNTLREQDERKKAEQ